MKLKKKKKEGTRLGWGSIESHVKFDWFGSNQVLSLFIFFCLIFFIITSIVFRLGLVQGQSSGLPESIFLNQNDVVLVKKQKLTGCNRVLTGSCQVNMPGQLGHTGFFLPLFFLTRSGSSLESTGSKAKPSDQAAFQNYGYKLHWKNNKGILLPP